MAIQPPLSLMEAGEQGSAKCDLSQKFCHGAQKNLVNHSGLQLAIMQSDSPLCSCRCKSVLCILVARTEIPKSSVDGEMVRDYLFAIQKVRKLHPPKGKNAWAADFQSFMLSGFSLLPPCLTLVGIHKSPTKIGVRHENRGSILAFPLYPWAP
jgi:hypothetical protein